jgi:iron complex transport system substrate-binding protein
LNPLSSRPRRPLARRAIIATFIAAALALGTGACSAVGGDSDTAQNGSAGSGAFPVTIKQAQGDVTIPSKPKRIVTLGWASTDADIALGTIPVGAEKSSWGGDSDGQYPWIVKAVKKAGGTLPQMVTMYPELDIKKVVELKPDLILAPYSGLTDAQYKQLSQLAPTVSFPKVAWDTTWDQAIEISGKAMGKPDEARDIVADIKKRFAKAAADNPEFDGTTFAYLYSSQPGTLGVYQQGDSRVDYLRYLGFTVDPKVDALPRDAGQNYSQIGMESADVLDDTQLVVAWFNDEANRKEVDAQPLYAQIPAVERGAYLPMTDPTVAMARTLITPYTLDYALDDYVADLKAAVAKADATGR